MHVANVDADKLKPIQLANVAEGLTPDDRWPSHYQGIGKEFGLHESTNHTQKEYAKASKVEGVRAHSNTVERTSASSNVASSTPTAMSASITCSATSTTFDFRFSNRTANGVNDFDRALSLLVGVKGKRLTYQMTVSAERKWDETHWKSREAEK